uniref:EGF-like domain-containing protein n=1 Tax=Parascaris univalens TaxID=6257 RepID=A0A915BY90_PARUN
QMRSLCLAMCLLALARAQRKAFVNPQSECRIQCLNGGFCAYLVDNPTVHTCLCLLDMFTGDHCQYRVVHTTLGLSTATTKTTTTTRAPPPHYSDDNPDYEESQTTVVDTEESKNDGEEEGDEDYTEGWDSVEEDYGNEEDIIKPDGGREGRNKVKGQSRSDMNGHVESDSHVTEESRDSTETRDLNEGNFNGVANDGGFYEHVTPTESSPFDFDSSHYSNLDDDTSQSEQMVFLQNKRKSAERKVETSTERSRELIPDAEAEDDGWMMSKRRRVANQGVPALTAESNYAALLLLGAFGFLS